MVLSKTKPETYIAVSENILIIVTTTNRNTFPWTITGLQTDGSSPSPKGLATAFC